MQRNKGERIIENNLIDIEKFRKVHTDKNFDVEDSKENLLKYSKDELLAKLLTSMFEDISDTVYNVNILYRAVEILIDHDESAQKKISELEKEIQTLNKEVKTLKRERNGFNDV